MTSALLLRPGGWSPRNLGGQLLCWWDASDYSTLFFDTGIKAWVNKARAGAAAVNATGSQQPTYNPTGLNSRPTVTLSGAASQRLLLPSLLVPQLWSAFAISSHTGSSGQLLSSDDTSANRMATYIRNPTATGVLGRAFNTVPTQFDSPTKVGTNPGLQETFRLDTTVGASVNGNAITTTATTGTPAQLTIGVMIGAALNASTFWTGSVSEILLCSPSLEPNDCRRVEGYLCHKWGNVGNLPATHVYKKSPP